MRWRTGLLAIALAGAACSSGQTAAHPQPSSTSLPAARAPAPTEAPRSAPTRALPPYAIESLRARAYPGGKLAVGDQMLRGDGYTKYHMTWPSNGQTMT